MKGAESPFGDQFYLAHIGLFDKENLALIGQPVPRPGQILIMAADLCGGGLQSEFAAFLRPLPKLSNLVHDPLQARNVRR